MIATGFFLDDSVIGFVNAHRTPALLRAGQLVSKWSEWQWLMLPCVLIAVAAHLRKKKALVRVMCAVMISASLAGLGANFIRGVTGRTRPNAPKEIAQGWYGPWHNGRLLLVQSHYNAFPSGHVATSTGLVAMLVLLRRRVGLLLAPLPVVVAAARICVGAHHLSDVLTSALFGIIVAVLLRRRFANLPEADPSSEPSPSRL